MSSITSARKAATSNCLPFVDANQHLGTTQCVSGTVFHVEHGNKGATFLTFCHTAKACPFTVVVLPGI